MGVKGVAGDYRTVAQPKKDQKKETKKDSAKETKEDPAGGPKEEPKTEQKETGSAKVRNPNAKKGGADPVERQRGQDVAGTPKGLPHKRTRPEVDQKEEAGPAGSGTTGAAGATPAETFESGKTVGSSATAPAESTPAQTVESGATVPTRGTPAQTVESGVTVPTRGTPAQTSGSGATVPVGTAPAQTAASGAAVPSGANKAGTDSLLGSGQAGARLRAQLQEPLGLKPMVESIALFDSNELAKSVASSLPQAKPIHPSSLVVQHAGDAGSVEDPRSFASAVPNKKSYSVVSALQAIENSNPAAIENLVTENDDGSFTVKMYDNDLKPFETTITEEDMFDTGSIAFSSRRDQNTWTARAVETAFLKHHRTAENLAKYREGGEYSDTKPALSLSALTGEKTSYFNLNNHFQGHLNEQLQAGKAVVVSSLLDGAGGSLKQVNAHPYSSWALVDYDAANEEYGAYNREGSLVRVKASDLLSNDLWATVAGDSLQPAALDPHKSNFTREDILNANPELSGKLLEWGFEQAGGADRVSRERAQQIGVMGKVLATSGTHLEDVQKLNKGADGGILNALRDRKISYDDMPDFVRDFARLGFNQRGYQLDSARLQSFAENAKHVDKDVYQGLWQAGVRPYVIASLTDDRNGGLLKGLNDRKLGTEGMKNAIDRITSVRTDSHLVKHHSVTDDSKKSLSSFIDIAKHKPNEWAQSLLATDVPHLDYVTETLNTSTLREIIDDRKVGADRAGAVFEWAYQQSDDNLSSTLTALEKFNEWAKPRSRSEILARIDSGNFEGIL